MSICKNKYEVAIEYSGPYALFADPMSGSNKVSYPAPTKTAVRGIIGSVLYMTSVKIEPYKTEIMNNIEMEDLQFNSRTWLRRDRNIKNDNASQMTFTLLKNVRYRSYAWVSNRDPEVFYDHLSDKAKSYEKNKTNHAHSYKAQFDRRAKNGKYFRLPHLGLKKFAVDNFGPIKDPLEKPIGLTINIGPMLTEMFDNDLDGNVKPDFSNNTRIKDGVIYYD